MINRLSEISYLTINKVQSKTDDLGTLDDMVISVLSEKMSQLQRIKDHINVALLDPVVTTDPKALMKLQAIMADYTTAISLIEKFAGSLIKTMDTLVKS